MKRFLATADFRFVIRGKSSNERKKMIVQATLEDDAGYHASRILRIMVIDEAGRLIHSSDFCIPCLMSKILLSKKVILYRENFNTGKETIHNVNTSHERS